MKREFIASIVIYFASCAAQSLAQSPALPIPDGTYALKPQFCRMKLDEAIQITEAAFIEIEGSKITYYESYCDIRNVKVNGTDVRFRQVCSSEGEVDISNRRLVVLPSQGFTMDGQTYTYCGKRPRR
jgi:hypothetical protein